MCEIGDQCVRLVINAVRVSQFSNQVVTFELLAIESRAAILGASSIVNKDCPLAVSAIHVASWIAVVPSHLDPSNFLVFIKWHVARFGHLRRFTLFCLQPPTSSSAPIASFLPVVFQNYAQVTLDPLGHHVVSWKHAWWL